MRGLSHRAYGKPRQDEYGYRLTSDGRFLVLCVADRLSSGSRSHMAAEVAVRTGVTCGIVRRPWTALSCAAASPPASMRTIWTG